MDKKIKRNRAQCPQCKDIVESLFTHDFQYCSCKGIFVDGGKDYIRRGFRGNLEPIEMNEYEE